MSEEANAKRVSTCDIRADWMITRRPEHAEGEFSDFKFQGVGWYYANGDSMLVTESTIPGVYVFHVFNGRDGKALFEQAAQLPRRATVLG